MKSTIIYGKKKITMGEFIDYYSTNIYWFGILLLNLFGVHFFGICVKNKIDDNSCSSDSICQQELEIIQDKLFFSFDLVCVGIALDLLILLTKKYTEEFVKKNNFLEFAPIWLYILSSIIYKPMCFIIFDKKIEEKQELIIQIVFIELFFVFFEFASGLLLLLLFIFVLIYFFEKIQKYFCKIYTEKIKNISFEYVETKFVDVEKNL